MKKRKNKESKKKTFSIVPMESSNEKAYHVMVQSGEDITNVEYILTSIEVEAGILYTMRRSNDSSWSKDARGKILFQVINTGDGYNWNKAYSGYAPENYCEFYELSTFLRLIQELESRSFSTSILEVKEIVTFKF